MKALISHNFGLKMIALTLAVLLEVYFYSPDNSITEEFAVPIEIKNHSQSFMVVGPPDAERRLFTNIVVRGPRTLVKQTRAQALRFKVEIFPNTPMKFSKSFSASELSLSSGVTVLKVEPSVIEFELEKVVRKELLVLPDKSGEPGEGYYVESVDVFPQSVFASGPGSELEGAAVVETLPLDVSGMTESKQLEVPLRSKGPLTSLGVNVVTVDVVVKPLQEKKELEKVNVSVLAPNGFAATVEPSRVSLVLTGPKTKLDNLMIEDIDLVADASGLGEGQHVLSPKARFPKGVSVVSMLPDKVNVSLVSSKKAAKDSGK